tara:strand:- start:66 stop:2708 length:2643 start_codon:yes stop_codon:yes gene_type:complete
MKRKHPLAKCEVCPLRNASFVAPEANKGAHFALVSDWPTDFEVEQNRPVVGQAGNHLVSLFRRNGMSREKIHWTMAVCCQPPNNDMKRFLADLRKRNRKIEAENRKRKKEGLNPIPQIPTPMECCEPRLKAELHDFKRIVPCGTPATQAVLHKSATITDLRGSPTEIETVEGKVKHIFPIFHPAYVQASPKFKHILVHDVAKAVRWFKTGKLNWKPPHIVYNPSPSDLRQFLSQDVPFWTYDTETDGIESLTANIRCIGIGTPTAAVVIGLLSIDGRSTFYSPSEQWEIVRILKEFFESEKTVIAGHNSGYYDLIVMKQRLGIEVTNNIDTMLLHRLVESELPHSLGFVGSMYSDAPSWKTDRQGRKKAYGSETDFELHEYCAYDVAVTASVLPQLMPQVVERKQQTLIASDHKLQRICADMHTVGMYVDQEKRKEYETLTLRAIAKQRTTIREVTGVANLNPASTKQLRELLYEKWKLEPPLDEKFKFTSTGDLSTGDDVLRSLLTVKTLTPQQRIAITQIRYYRRNQKLLGTYITKLRYASEEAWGGWDDDDDWVEKEWREKYGIKKLGIVDPKTGRMFPGYNAHVTSTGRLSSSKPINAQNFPSFLRSMVCASPNNVLVGADMDQLDLRIAADRWESEKYIEAFKNGHDPHSTVTAVAIFGDMFVKAAGCAPPYPTGHPFKGNAKKLRKLGKGIQYASQYKAGVETVHRVITTTEVDDDTSDEWGATKLPYISMSVREVRKMHQKWCDGAKFDLGWEAEIEFYRRHGFLCEPVLHRRRDFLNGENINEIVNFPIQAAAASLMNIAIIELSERIPLHKWGVGTGIINQCHDSIVVECPKSEAEWVAKQIEDVLNFHHPAFPHVKFTAKADIAHRWSEV